MGKRSRRYLLASTGDISESARAGNLDEYFDEFLICLLVLKCQSLFQPQSGAVMHVSI